MVLIAEARAVARDWVRGQTGPDLVGAFLAGSSAVGPGGDELATTSDVDLVLVTSGVAPAKVGKLWHDGVLLDVSSLSAAELEPRTIAGTSYLAPFFTDAMIIHDPAGALAALHDQVRGLVDQPVWVRRRVTEVRTKITSGLAAADPTAPLAQQVIGWVFPASLPTVQLLVAAGRPPTVRKRYLRCQQLLAGTSDAPPDLYERLLAALGCADVTSDQVRRHLDGLADTLRVTATHARTPFPFSSDLRPDTWHIALDGSVELVDAGLAAGGGLVAAGHGGAVRDSACRRRPGRGGGPARGATGRRRGRPPRLRSGRRSAEGRRRAGRAARRGRSGRATRRRRGRVASPR